MVITPWHDYLVPTGGANALAACRNLCLPAFASQRNTIEQIAQKLQPTVVACLGAGPLNDIPLDYLVGSQATVHLVDWMQGSIDFGLTRSIIEQQAAGDVACIFCRLSAGTPEQYCLSYQKPADASQTVCPAYADDTASGETCASYRKGTLPHVHYQDVTGGYASAFATALGDALDGVTTWRQAFRRAITLARRVKKRRTPLDIADHSIDLAISSLLVSQFEFEPYDYFSRQVSSLIGPPSTREEKQLRPLIESLRAELVTNQVLGHCDEIERILAADGHCFMAFEMFHREHGSKRWFLVHEMHRILELIADRFAFDFDSDPQPETQTLFEATTGRSIIQHFLLSPKS